MMAAEEAVGKRDYRGVYIYCRQVVRSMFAGLDQHFPIARRGFFVRTRLLHVISASSNEKGLKIISTGSNAADRQDYEGVCGRLLPPCVGIERSGCPNDITYETSGCNKAQEIRSLRYYACTMDRPVRTSTKHNGQ